MFHIPVQDQYTAGLYLRLSVEDENTKKESDSISNQRRMLMEYAEKNGFLVPSDDYIYADDGYTGTNYDRPDFNRMIADAQSKKINVIIVKDLSRLGRDHIKTGEYMEQIFPKMRIRLIAISDGYDSLECGTAQDMAPFLNLFNEHYAKDTSRKVRNAKDSLARAGKFIGNKAPFGYAKDPEDKHHLLVDPEAAVIVKLIFRYAASGMGYKAISRRLRDDNVLNPHSYNNIKYPTFHKSEYWQQPHDWHASSIKAILKNPTYLGKIVSGRRRSLSYKSKDIITIDPSNWIVVDDMHEAIISQELWDTVQLKLSQRSKCDNQGEVHIFHGLIKCSDCGYAMVYRREGNKGGSYTCSLYNIKGKGYCSSRNIPYDDLYELVLTDIRRKARAASKDPEYFLSKLQKHNKMFSDKIREKKREQQKNAFRLSELETVITKVHEERLIGKLPEEQAAKLLEKFEIEKEGISQRQQVLFAEINEYDNRASTHDWFSKTISKYSDITELDAEILNELIDRIEVSKIENVDGVKSQQITIRYSRVGYLDAPLSRSCERKSA